jgi:hypothetical protein
MVENLREKALAAYEGIFNDLETIKIDGNTYHMDYTSRKGLRLFKMEGYSYLEQNPDTGSNWAKMARDGHQIMWVLNGRQYLAQVRDGVFKKKKKKEE